MKRPGARPHMTRPPVKPFYVLSQTAPHADAWCVVDSGTTREYVDASAERRETFARGLAGPDSDRHILFLGVSLDELREMGLARLVEKPKPAKTGPDDTGPDDTEESADDGQQ